MPQLKGLFIYFAASFLLHLIWELAQAPLFAGFTTYQDHFSICLVATATGDMIFMALIYICLVAVHQDWSWPTNPQAPRHPGTWIIPIVVGILLAASFEMWAIYVVERWTYGAMPLIPIINIGLTPILQMIIVPILTLLIVFMTSSYPKRGR